MSAIRDRAYYDAAIADRQATLATRAAELAAGAYAPNPGFYCLAHGKHDDLIWLRLARGDAPAEVKAALLALIEPTETWIALEAAADAAHAASGAAGLRAPSFTGGVYCARATKAEPVGPRRVLRWLSLAVLLRLEGAEAARLTSVLLRPGAELLLDLLAGALVPGWPRRGKLVLPALHGPLIECLEGGLSEADRVDRLDGYVRGWRKRMRGPEFGPFAPGSLDDVGYTCVEAAAVALLSGTPDDRFRDHRDYPRAWTGAAAAG